MHYLYKKKCHVPELVHQHFFWTYLANKIVFKYSHEYNHGNNHAKILFLMIFVLKYLTLLKVYIYCHNNEHQEKSHLYPSRQRSFWIIVSCVVISMISGLKRFFYTDEHDKISYFCLKKEKRFFSWKVALTIIDFK